MSVFCVCMSFVVLYLILYLFVVIAEKGIAKMKEDDIEKLFESMKEEFKLIYRAEQEKKKEIAEKEAKRQEERQLKEQEEQKLRDEIELKRKEARRIALE